MSVIFTVEISCSVEGCDEAYESYSSRTPVGKREAAKWIRSIGWSVVPDLSTAVIWLSARCPEHRGKKIRKRH